MLAGLIIIKSSILKFGINVVKSDKKYYKTRNRFSFKQTKLNSVDF